MSGPPDSAPDRPPVTGVSAQVLREALAGEPPYRVDQIHRAVYREAATGFEQILTLPAGIRAALRERFRYEALREVRCETSSDGTRKALFRTADGAAVETVQMPTERSEATTICLSSQAGCGLGCTFCATGAMGLTRNLTASEIVDQFLHFRRRSDARRTPDRAVFMGMGEPLANLRAVEAAVRTLVDPAAVGLSARRVTVSTVGLPRGIWAMAGWGLPVSLAISLHAPDDDVRTEARSGRPTLSARHADGGKPALPATGAPTRDLRIHVAGRGERWADAGRGPGASATGPALSREPDPVQRLSRRALPADAETRHPGLSRRTARARSAGHGSAHART